MNIRIKKWGGRLGNNLQQLTNAIQVALYYNYNISILQHKYFNKTYIIINDSIKETDDYDKNIIADGNGKWADYFYFDKITNIDSELFNLNINKTLQILKSIFIIKTDYVLGDKDVVFHIRSGDIFTVIPNSKYYIMPPLSYYQNIINNNNFDKIFIISENISNPVINKLIKLYPNIEYYNKGLEDDIKLLLSSKNVVESYGTFTSSLLLLSNNIINIYKPSYQFKSLLSKENFVNIYEYDLDEYYKKLYPWKNTKEQCDFLLNY